MSTIDNMTIGDAKAHLAQAEELRKLLGHQPTQATASDEWSGGEVRIVILQRGWCFVGRHYTCGEQRKLEGASVIRVWGTSSGLGEIAKGGPTSKTKIDHIGTVRWNELTEVATIDCEQDKWAALVK